MLNSFRDLHVLLNTCQRFFVAHGFILSDGFYFQWKLGGNALAHLKPYFSTSVERAFAMQRAGPHHVRFGLKADIALEPISKLLTVRDPL
jgi:hypothetical protein